MAWICEIESCSYKGSLTLEKEKDLNYLGNRETAIARDL